VSCFRCRHESAPTARGSSSIPTQVRPVLRVRTAIGRNDRHPEMLQNSPGIDSLAAISSSPWVFGKAKSMRYCYSPSRLLWPAQTNSKRSSVRMQARKMRSSSWLRYGQVRKGTADLRMVTPSRSRDRRNSLTPLSSSASFSGPRTIELIAIGFESRDE